MYLIIKHRKCTSQLTTLERIIRTIVCPDHLNFAARKPAREFCNIPISPKPYAPLTTIRYSSLRRVRTDYGRHLANIDSSDCHGWSTSMDSAHRGTHGKTLSFHMTHKAIVCQAVEADRWSVRSGCSLWANGVIPKANAIRLSVWAWTFASTMTDRRAFHWRSRTFFANERRKHFETD